MDHDEFTALMLDLEGLCLQVRRAEEALFYDVPLGAGIELEAACMALREARDRIADQ